MKYKNKKTGQVIMTTGRVTGGDWELIAGKKPKTAEAPKAPDPTKKPAAKPAGKKTSKSGGGEGA